MFSNVKSIVRCKAPLRLGLAGGGTDLSPYCDEFGGAILNCTFTKFAFVSISHLATKDVCFASMDTGAQKTLSIEQFAAGAKPGREFDLANAVYHRICRDYLDGEVYPLRIETAIDAPIGSGLGSSSALVVALVEAFAFAFDLPLGQYEVGHLAWEIERLDLGLAGGKQDQYAAAFGGFNFMEFLARDRVIVNPIRLPSATRYELEASLVIAYTGISRHSAEIISDQVRSTNTQGSEALESMHALREDAFDLKAALLRWDPDAMARILNRSWLSKKKTSKAMTSDAIDSIYECALAAGALGGKISGAGGGGFMMFLVDPARRDEVRASLRAKGAQAEYVTFFEDGAHAWIAPETARRP